MQPKFRGIFIPLITPFHDDGEVDFEALSEVTEFMIERGVNGLFVLGSTGMGPVMTTEQRIAAAEFVVKQVRRRLPVIMHVGTADVQTTVALAKHADGLGVDAVAAYPPLCTQTIPRGRSRHISKPSPRQSKARYFCTTTRNMPAIVSARPRLKNSRKKFLRCAG